MTQPSPAGSARIHRAAAALTFFLSLATACSDDGTRVAGPVVPPTSAALSFLGADAEPGARVTLTSPVAPGKCLTILGAIQQDVRTAMRDCDGSANQSFMIGSDATLRPAESLCLDANTGFGRDGDEIIIWECHGGANQSWVPTAASELRGVRGKCLDVADPGWRPNQPIILWRCHGGANQKWTARVVSASTNPSPTPPGTTPAPPETSPASNDFSAVVGDLPSRASVEGLGGVFTQYERDFSPYDEQQWAQCGPRWNCINYYDRAAIYFVRFARTGESKYLERAKATALDYRRNYLEANGFGIAHYWSMMEGVGLHYLATGDQASLTAVGKVADNFAYHTPKLTEWIYLDNRFQAYYLRSLLLAWELKAPSVGVPNLGIRGGNDWGAHLRAGLTNILASRDLGQARNIQGRAFPAGTRRANDGIWRAAQCGVDQGYTNKVHPFQVGLLLDALTRYYDEFQPDPRILEAVRANADYMWANDWNESRQGFLYVEPNCPLEGYANPSPDLNGLIVNAYSWLYRHTGDAGYKQKADQIFAGGVKAHGVTAGTKQFNQQYTYTYRYLRDR